MASDGFTRLLKTWAGQPADPAGVCPDAEVLAAFMERNLPRRAYDAVASHVSECARCTEHLAALSRLEDVAGASNVVVSGRLGWLRRPWLVPVMAAVVVAVVWTALPSKDRITSPAPARSVSSADHKALAGRAVDAPPVSLPDANSAMPSARAAQKPVPIDTLEKRAAIQSRPQRAAGGQSDEEFERDKETNAPSAALRQKRPAASPAPGSPPAAEERPGPVAETVIIDQAVKQRGDDAAQKKDERASAGDTVTNEAKSTDAFRREGFADTAPAQPQSATGAVAGGVPGAYRPQAQATAPARTLAAAKVAEPLLFESPDRHVRWRVIGTRIERSTDGGHTWMADRAPAITGARAGASSSADVGWLVGSGGLVARRDASGSWTVTSPPAPNLLLVAVTASSATDAIVTADDGTRYRTTDGGRSWNPVD